ncbi:hypothetical protein JCM10450v2_003316 [Rhodotorula kratochvilovae]
MLDRLPVELARHILSLAHPPPAGAPPSYAAALLARQRSLVACRLVCKSLKDVARELLWEHVWYRPYASSQVDHLVTTDGGEGGLVRIFEYEHFQRFELPGDTSERVDPMDVIRKTPSLVELTINQDVAGGELDVGLLASLENLTHLVIEGNGLRLRVAAGERTPPRIFPHLQDLVLQGVFVPPTLFRETSLPRLEALALVRVVAEGSHPSPSIPPEFMSRLRLLHISISDYALDQQRTNSEGTRVVAVFEDRDAYAVSVAVVRAHSSGRGNKPFHASTAKYTVLSPNLVPVTRQSVGREVPAITVVTALIRLGLIDTLFLPHRLRFDESIAILGPTPEQDQFKAAAYTAGVETYFLDEEADVALWPDWAREDTALRRLVKLTERRDAEKAFELQVVRDALTRVTAV